MTKQPTANRPALLLLGGVLLLVTSGVLAWLFLDWGYGELGRDGYNYATALYSICNQKDAARLQKLSEMLEVAKEKQQLGPDEARWIEQIVAQGRQGDWEAAQKSVRKLMMRQVE